MLQLVRTVCDHMMVIRIVILMPLIQQSHERVNYVDENESGCVRRKLYHLRRIPYPAAYRPSNGRSALCHHAQLHNANAIIKNTKSTLSSFS